MNMNILIGCEESGEVRNAFAALGHNAYSCDLLPSRSEGQHLQCDIFEALDYLDWDIIILHPDCTKLTVSGNRYYGTNKPKAFERVEAIKWTEKLWEVARSKARIGVCLENPVGVLSTQSTLGVPSQYIQPWQYGHGETKKTGLWLHNLPSLLPTNIVAGREQRVWKMPPSPTRKRDRSQTYRGIAEAMADQWGSLCQI